MLALEVSRLARSNSDWYRLLDLAGLTDTLLADTDGVYHPGLFNDRLTLGLKGTMAEAELHVLGPAGRRDTEQGRTRGTAPRRCRSGWSGARTRRGAAAPGRGRHRSDPRGVRPVRRLRVGPRDLAVAAGRRAEVAAAAAAGGIAARGDWVAPTYHAVHHVDPSRPTLAPTSTAAPGRRARRPRPDVRPGAASSPRRLGGPHPRPPSMVSSAGTLPGQPGSGSAGTSAPSHMPPGRARSGRAARCCRASRSAGPAGGSSPSSTTAAPHPPPATTAPAPDNSSTGTNVRHLRDRRRRHRRRRHGQAFLARSPRRRVDRLPGRGRRAAAAWTPRSRTAPPGGGTGPLRRHPRRTPLPGRRRREPAGRKRPGSRVGEGADRAWPQPRPNWPAARHSNRKPLPRNNNPGSSRWAATSTWSGPRRPPPTGTARNS